MEALVISPDFTIEDIHKIREQNYERTKDMTVEEEAAYYSNSGKEEKSAIQNDCETEFDNLSDADKL